MIDRIGEEKIIAILRLPSVNDIEEIGHSLYEGGIRVLEVTLNTPGALKAIPILKGLYPDFIVGAGTVLDQEDATGAIEAGADFMLAPTLDQGTIQVGTVADVPVVPGVFTPTEAFDAYRGGARLVKVFPVNHLKTRYIKDLNGPLPFIQGMAVGGVSAENLAEYLRSGWHSAGIGSSLVHPKWVERKEYHLIKQAAEKLVAIREWVKEERM